MCDTCNSGCIEEIRYNKPFREIWHLEIDSFVFDDIIDPSSFRSPKQIQQNSYPHPYTSFLHVI